MITRPLGSTGIQVSALGPGCMGMSNVYGPADRQESIATVAQVAIAWVLARGSDIIPLIGARRRDRPSEAMDALALKLSPQDLAAIEGAIPTGWAAGERYSSAHMADLDSEG